ncbi:unnamed protein product [Rhizoctonia solani]|uniref:ZZ-type domain-containing protein n=1 Tax=Rhizoctonia solani TaxID=456999 RepID=A0A8H3CY20_9AGAM|nr:unnamed protein product [Rhizoctonia solani]
MTLAETLGINSRPTKPCKDMSEQELIEEELWHRMELTRLVLSLSIHIGTCTTHGVLSAGTTLPLHLPVVVFIAYRLTKIALRHRAIKAEVKTNRSGIQFRRLSSGGGKRLTGGIVLMILTPILAAVGADLVNEIVSAIAGSDPIAIANIGSSSSTLALGECSADGSGTDFVLATGDDSCDNDVSACGEASEAIIEELLEIWSEKLIHSVSNEFKQLVEEIDTANKANKILPSHYQLVYIKVYCNACHTRIKRGYSCVECHDLDLCHGCFIGTKHQDVWQHAYTEFKVQEEISQIQRIMISLRRESVVVEHGRGSHTRCNICRSTISEPTKLSKQNKATVKLVPTSIFALSEAAKNIHEDHKFNMVLATDDEATILRLSPATRTRRLSGSSYSSSSSYLKTPVDSSESLASSTLLLPRSHSSLFSPTFGPTPPISPILRSPSYSSVPENIWFPGQSFACDACQRNIDDDHRLSCVDCEVDLHVKCQNWSVRGHERYHRTRIFVKAP